MFGRPVCGGGRRGFGGRGACGTGRLFGGFPGGRSARPGNVLVWGAGSGAGPGTRGSGCFVGGVRFAGGRLGPPEFWNVGPGPDLLGEAPERFGELLEEAGERDQHRHREPEARPVAAACLGLREHVADDAREPVRSGEG